MQKIKLDLDALTVASFATADEETSTRGTVEGQAVITTVTTAGPLADWALSWLIACSR